MKILKGFQPPPNDLLPVYSPMPSIEYFPPDFGTWSPAQSPAYQSPKNKPADYFSGCQQDDDAVSPSTVSLTPQSLVKSVKCNNKYIQSPQVSWMKMYLVMTAVIVMQSLQQSLL